MAHDGAGDQEVAGGDRRHDLHADPAAVGDFELARPPFAEEHCGPVGDDTDHARIVGRHAGDRAVSVLRDDHRARGQRRPRDPLRDVLVLGGDVAFHDHVPQETGVPALQREHQIATAGPHLQTRCGRSKGPGVDARAREVESRGVASVDPDSRVSVPTDVQARQRGSGTPDGQLPGEDTHRILDERRDG